MTLEKIAEICHETNRAYCSSIGDTSQVPWNEAPEWQKQSAIKGVEFHVNNPLALPEDSHNSWLAEKQEQGWKYGPVKDADKKEHPCYVAYHELPLEQQAKDYLFGAIAKSMIDLHRLRGNNRTRGEEVMNVDFNPGGNQSVKRLKAAFANLWDVMKREHDFAIPHILIRKSKEWKANGWTDEQIANARPMEVSDCTRNMSIGHTNLETSQMFAVKSVTR